MKKPTTVVDIIVGKMKPTRKPDAKQSSDFVQEIGDGSPESEKSIMEEAAAEELIQAIKLGDAAAVSEALKRHHEICYGSPEMDDMEDMMEEEDDEY